MMATKKNCMIVFFAIFLFWQNAFAQNLNHIFFIAQKQTFNVGGIDYQAWPITSNGSTYYFMEAGDPRPDSPQVYDIVAVLASSGVNDMIYFMTNKAGVALIATDADEYAGGSNVSTAAAWLTFAVMSYRQQGAHAAFPVGAASNLALTAKWKNGEGEWMAGNINEWAAAGYPTTGFHVTPQVVVFGSN